jgi:beta-lactamase regulating signal transducer with metallopeptidase domain
MSGETAWQLAEALATWAWRASWQGAALALLVGAVLALVGRKLSPGWRFGLWALVLVRLAMPAVLEVRSESNDKQQATSVQKIQSTSSLAHKPIVELTEAEFKAIAAAQPENASTPALSPTTKVERRNIAVRTRVAIASAWPRAKPYLVAVWLAGVLLLALRVGWSSRRLARAVRGMRGVTNGRVVQMLDECCREMAITRPLQVRELPAAGGAPALVGFIRPSVLLPVHVLDDMGDEELRLILMHELAHVKRRDVLINWLGTCVAVVHWPNPAAWGVLWRMRVERELACDELVLRAGRGTAYARTIVRLVEALSSSSSSAAGRKFGGRVPAAAAAVPTGGAVGILEGKAQIQRRLLMIARFDAKRRRWPAVAAGFSLIVGALALAGATRAADPAGNKTQPVKGTAENKTTSATTATPTEAPVYTAGDPNESAQSKPKPPARAQTVTFTVTPASPEDDQASARTREKLKKPLAKVDFNGQALGDVIDFLRDAAGVDILVEWAALEQNGIPRDAPVTIQLREPTPVDAVLQLMFRSMGLGLQYEVEKGVVVIGPSSQRAAAVTRVYDVSDLVAATPTFGAPVPGPVPPVGGGVGPEGGMITDMSDVGQLIRLIMSTVEPNSWRDSGGELGSITFFKNKLVIKTSEPVHKEITSLLEMLREKPSGKRDDPKTKHF